jgi:hypothetical protein
MDAADSDDDEGPKSSDKDTSSVISQPSSFLDSLD